MKTVVTDLDGTLLSNGELSLKSIEILDEFQKHHRLILATGRNRQSVQWIYQKLHMEEHQTGAMILLNGLAMYDFHDHEYIQYPSFDHVTAKKIIRICYLLFFRITIVTSNKRIQYPCLYDQIYDFLRHIIKHKPKRVFEKPNILDDIEKIELGGSIFFEFFYFILKRCLRSYEVVRVSQYWIEILPLGVNKVNMLQYLIHKYHISMEDLYVFGDGENDLEMLAFCKNSICPKNAPNWIKTVARNQCLSNDEDGVIQYIDEFIK